MKLKRILATVLAIAMLVSMMPTALAVNTGKPATSDYALNLKGDTSLILHEGDEDNEKTLSRTDCLVLGMYLTVPSTDNNVSLACVALKVDATKLKLRTIGNNGISASDQDWSTLYRTPSNAVTNGGASNVDGLSSLVYVREIDEQYALVYFALQSSGSGFVDTGEDETLAGAIAFSYAGGGLESLDKDSIQVMSLDDSQDFWGGYSGNAVIKTTQTFTAYEWAQGQDTSVNYQLPEPIITYPRSTAESAVTLSTNETNISEKKDGGLTTIAPAIDKEYTTEDWLAKLIPDGLAEDETAEITDVSFGTEGKYEWTQSGEDEVIVSQGTVDNTFAAQTATVTIEVTSESLDTYEAEVEVTIPEAAYPAKVLDPDSGVLLENKNADDTPWTASAAMAIFLVDDNEGWVLASEENISNYSDEEGLTAVEGAQTLTAEDSPYEIPVYYARNGDAGFDHTVAVFTLTITKAPTEDDFDDPLVDPISGELNYTATKTTITFPGATNIGWQYGLAATDGSDDKTAVGSGWAAGTAEGVTITGLNPGTDYYLILRGADDAGNESDPVKYTESPATTKYDLKVQSAEFKKDFDTITGTVNDPDDADDATRSIIVDTLSLTPETAEGYVYSVTILNDNGHAITITSVEVQDNKGSTSEVFTATVDPQVGQTVTANNTFTVNVTPNSGKLVRGVNSAVIVIKAQGAEGEEIEESFPLDLVIYDHRTKMEDPDVILRVPGSAAANQEGEIAAESGTTIDLKYIWKGQIDDSGSVDNDIEATSYAVTIEEGYADKAEFDGEHTLTLKEDITDLGKIATVTASIEANDEYYYLDDEEEFGVFVKGNATDALPDPDPDDPDDVEKDPIKGEVYYYVVLGDEQQTIDLLANLKDDDGNAINGATVEETEQKHDSVSLDSATGVITIAAKGQDDAPGSAKFTVNVPATDDYDAGTITVIVYIMTAPEMEALPDVDLVWDDGTFTDEKGAIVTTVGPLTPEITLGGAKQEGKELEYTIVKLITDDNGTEVNGAMDESGNIVLANLGVTGACKFKVTVTLPADTENYTTPVSQSFILTVRLPAVFNNYEDLEYTEEELKDDSEEPKWSSTITLGKDGMAVNGNGMTGSELTYTLVSGSDIITLNDDGTFTFKNEGNFGKAVIKVSAKEIATNAAGSIEINVYVRKANDGTSTDPDTDDPFNGTGTGIVGNTDKSGTEFPYELKQSDDDENEYAWVKTDDDSIEPKMAYVKFQGLTIGVAYEVRLLKDDGTWLGTGEDGWFDLFNNTVGVDGDQVTTSDVATNTFKIIGTTGDPIYTYAEIRYKDDGTVGDVIVKKDDDYNWTIHNLNDALNYKYRVKKNGVWDTEFEGVEADENGWIVLPKDDEKYILQTDPTYDTSLYQYTVTRDYVIEDVEVTYYSKPTVTIDENGNFVITGLVPNANYDVAPFYTEDGEENHFTDEMVAGDDYLVITADEDGTITIYNPKNFEDDEYDDDHSDGKCTQWDYFDLDNVQAVLIRMSQTDSTLPGEEEPVAAGVKVSGSVYSYNKYNEVTISLYLMSDLDAAVAPYTVTVKGEDIPEDINARQAGQTSVPFELSSVAAGTYQMRIEKSGHLTTTINNVVVGNEDYVLDMTELNKDENGAKLDFVVVGHESEVNLICGQLDGDAENISLIDRTVIVDPDNLFHQIGSGNNEPSNSEGDLDGDGWVNLIDASIIVDPIYLFKNVENCTFTIKD